MNWLTGEAPGTPSGDRVSADAHRRAPDSFGSLAVRLGALLLVDVCFGFAARALVGAW